MTTTGIAFAKVVFSGTVFWQKHSKLTISYTFTIIISSYPQSLILQTHHHLNTTTITKTIAINYKLYYFNYQNLLHINHPNINLTTVPHTHNGLTTV